MTETKRPLKVFLCHAHSDKDAVKVLYDRLTKDGVDAWLDKAKLLPGQDWKLEIEKAVRETDVVVVCLSKQFNLEGFRQREVRWALDKALEKPEGEIFIIPARLEECETLESLRKWHWVDLFEANGYESLMRALRARANSIGANLQVKRSRLNKEAIPRTENEKLAETTQIETQVSLSSHEALNNYQKITSSELDLESSLQPQKPIDEAKKEKPQTFISRFFDIKILGFLIAVLVFLFGNNIYGQVTGHSVFADAFTPTATVTKTIVPSHTSTYTSTPPINISPTPTHTPVFILPESGYTIVDPADVFKLVAKTDPFGKIAKEAYTPQEINSVDRTLFYTIDGTPDQPMQWRWYWCATTEEILKQNVNGIDVVFQADGRLIPHEQLAFTTYSYPKDNGGIGWCATYSTVIKDWVPGVYHFVIASTLKSVINDGEATFLPGFQISDFTVKIHEPALKSEVVDDKGVPMGLVQGGSFQMGGGAKVDQQPIHAVYLNSYYIDAYEVSNALYKACVDADACQPPKDLSSATHPSYYTDSRFKNYPIVNVTWSEAETYCQWRDARLPTEAEWEKAARGVGGRTYPWGNLLECTYANYLDVGGTQCFVIGDTTPVDKYNKGVSPFGVYGLVGNVWEWVSDWYSETYYSVSPLGNPQGADSGQYRVMRGGSWKDDSNNMLPTLRNWYDPESYSNTIGFRCAKDVP